MTDAERIERLEKKVVNLREAMTKIAEANFEMLAALRLMNSKLKELDKRAGSKTGG